MTLIPIKHLIGTAAGWGGNPDKDATYIAGNVPKNDGTTVYRLRVKDVPVNAFWSVSVYNAAGYFEKNPYNAYSLNDITAKKDADGAVTIQLEVATGKFRTACRSCPAGITQCGSIGRVPKCWTEGGNFPIPNRQAEVWTFLLQPALDALQHQHHPQRD